MSRMKSLLTTSKMFLGLPLQQIGITECTTPVRVHEQVSLLMRSLKSNFFRRRSGDEKRISPRKRRSCKAGSLPLHDVPVALSGAICIDFNPTTLIGEACIRNVRKCGEHYGSPESLQRKMRSVNYWQRRAHEGWNTRNSGAMMLVSAESDNLHFSLPLKIGGRRRQL